MPRLELLEWVLLFLREQALDRIQLMKALFLFWHRNDRNVPGFFNFKPYMYGPCSFELYDVLEDAMEGRLVTQPPHQEERWAPYYLTDRGKAAAEAVAVGVPARFRRQVAGIVREVSAQNFKGLLNLVYAEAPDFATKSVVAGEGAR